MIIVIIILIIMMIIIMMTMMLMMITVCIFEVLYFFALNFANPKKKDEKQIYWFVDMKFCCSILNSNRNCPGFFEVVHCFVLYWGGSLRASSLIWASEASLARTRERGAEERRTKQGALHKRIQLIKGFHFPSTRTKNSVRLILGSQYSLCEN